MELKTLYTAIGRLERETSGCGQSCPVIMLGGQPYMMNMQEMVVWTALNWRISKWSDIAFQCDKLSLRRRTVRFILIYADTFRRYLCGFYCHRNG